MLLLVLSIVFLIGASACRQEAPIEFVPVGCRVIDRVINECPLKQIICQGGRELRSACLQHKEPGPCRAGIPKYYFNPLNKRCETFQYGGCLGNDNRFDTLYDCEAACSPEKLPEVLPYDELLSVDSGVCRQPRQQGTDCNSLPPTNDWHYDAQAGQCRSFRYLGCGGNDNRFPSKADCERRCSERGDNERNQETCKLPAKRGTCLSSHNRWFFDQDAGECASFVYSGCDSNENNFESKQECERACGKAVRCPYDRSRSYPVSSGCRVEWTRGSGPCETPVQVCDRDQQEVMQDEGNETHVCFKPAKKGRCSGSQVRFFYDSDAQDCIQFVYSGCESNGNNFDSKESCRSACRGVTDRSYQRRENRYIFASNDDDSVCAQPAEVGLCFDRQERFFFDIFSSRCVSFEYTGCGGNANNFASELECERLCSDQSTRLISRESDLDANSPAKFCYQSPEQGPCSNWERHYAYNATSGQCEDFWYGGCEGNKNNFRREPECRSTCSKFRAAAAGPNNRQRMATSKSVFACDQPADSGACFGQHQRWRYDTASQTCLTFSYTGCGGNENRFETNDACIDACTGYRTARANSDDIIGNIPSSLLYDPDYSKEVNAGAAPVIDRQRTIDCLQTPKPGPCKSALTRWYFDPLKGSCEAFQDGGCQANDNNFASRIECERSCVDDDEPFEVGYGSAQANYDLPSLCTEPMQPGPCRRREIKYWFNKVTRRCETFTYGGCGKNNNHFETESDCRAVCKGEDSGRSRRSHNLLSKPSHCEERNEYGNGEQNLRKWYYNSFFGKCEIFTYSGRGGNLNNFHSWQDCHETCEEGYQVASGRPGGRNRPSYCSDSMNEGYGTSYETRWYYNEFTNSCDEMIYKGNGGNGNRFHSRNDCESTCRP